MQDLTAGGEQAVQNLAQRYRISADAVRAMLLAVSAVAAPWRSSTSPSSAAADSGCGAG